MFYLGGCIWEVVSRSFIWEVYRGDLSGKFVSERLYLGGCIWKVASGKIISGRFIWEVVSRR